MTNPQPLACPIPPPTRVRPRSRRAASAPGFEALWAGGCVRDQLLGIAPEGLRRRHQRPARPDPRPLRPPPHARHRRLLRRDHRARPPRRQGQIEVATFSHRRRVQRRPPPGCRPLHHRRARRPARDFTINGLFFDPVASEVVDYVAGRADLEAHIGPRDRRSAPVRIAEDKLRMLRAVRFAATFDFAIEPGDARRDSADGRRNPTVSAERIGVELRRMLLGPNRAVALDLLRETKLLQCAARSCWRSMRPNFAGDSPRARRARAEPTLPLALAAILLTSEGGSRRRAVVGRRLRYTNHEIERTAWLLPTAPTLADAPHELWPRLQRVLVHAGGPGADPAPHRHRRPHRRRPRLRRRAARLAAGKTQPARRLSTAPI